MRNLIHALLFVFCCQFAYGQIVYIPDERFKTILLNSIVNTNNNNQIEVSEALLVEEIAIPPNSFVRDMTGIEAFLFLKHLECSENEITKLDISKNLFLKTVDCVYNRIRKLDISNLYYITDVNNYGNYGMNICVRPGQKDSVTFGHDETEVTFSTDCNIPFNIFIKDTIFLQSLIDLGYDKNLDGSIQYTEIRTIDTLSVAEKGIISLKGIEYFSKLVYLNSSGNKITDVDINHNTELVYVNLNRNKLSKLSLNKLSKIKHIECKNNTLTKLDFSDNLNLQTVKCDSNTITHLDISKLNFLTLIQSKGNINLSVICIAPTQPSLVVFKKSPSTQLRTDCFNVYTQNAAPLIDSYYDDENYPYNVFPVSFIKFDLAGIKPEFKIKNATLKLYNPGPVEGFAKHKYADIYNAYSHISLITTNWNQNTTNTYYTISTTKKGQLRLPLPTSDHQNFSIDVTGLTKDMLSSNNYGFKFDNFQFTLEYGGPEAENLSLIFGSFNHPNPKLHPQLLVEYECITCVPLDTNHNIIPDNNFRMELVNQGYDFNNDKSIQIDEVSDIDTLKVHGSSILSLEGIQYFKSMIYLDCSKNLLKEINLKQNLNLVYLNSAQNQIADLQLPSKTKLKYLVCNINNLRSLNVNNSPALLNLYCGDNQLIDINIESSRQLKRLSIHHNLLTNINISRNVALKYLSATANNLNALDLSRNADLTNLYCGTNKLTSLDVSKNLKLAQLDCRVNNTSKICINQNQINTTSIWRKDLAATWTVCNTVLGETHIQSNINEPILSVYPNPVKDILYVSGSDSQAKISIKDLNGKQLISAIGNQIDISNLNSGIYLVEVSTEQNVEMRKIVVE